MKACAASAGFPSRAEVTRVGRAPPGGPRPPRRAHRGRGLVTEPEEQERAAAAGADDHAGEVASVAGRLAAGDHIGGGRAQVGVDSGGIRALDRHHDRAGGAGDAGRAGCPVGAAGQPGEVSGQRPGAGCDHRGQPGLDRQGSASGGLERFRELSRFVSRQFDHKPATALERHAHHDAAAFLRDLERAITRPRLHRRHPASPSCPGPHETSLRPATGPPATAASAGDSPSYRSVDLLSRVRPPDGNDQHPRQRQDSGQGH
jgi:hypothetical protein